MNKTIKNHAPTVKKKSFRCPFCAAIAHQEWYQTFAKAVSGEEGIPVFPDASAEEYIKADREMGREAKERLLRYVEQINSKHAFFLKLSPSESVWTQVGNLQLSRCYSCKGVAIWVNDALVHPPVDLVFAPNPDLPEPIVSDFTEAAAIVEKSPRGAAALLRLTIQKVCIHLGQPGKNLNDDIAALVKAGLPLAVQQALDYVRVIGNHAVHPGQIDLKDDRDTANSLFELVNLIADRLISEPKKIAELYEGLPEAARNQVQKRDSQK